MKQKFRRHARQTCVIMAALAGLVAASTSARAWDANIIKNCTEDYFNFCSQFGPDDPLLKTCMESHRTQISKQCVQALLDSGEIPKKYLANAPSQSTNQSKK